MQYLSNLLSSLLQFPVQMPNKQNGENDGFNSARCTKYDDTFKVQLASFWNYKQLSPEKKCGCPSASSKATNYITAMKRHTNSMTGTVYTVVSDVCVWYHNHLHICFETVDKPLIITTRAVGTRDQTIFSVYCSAKRLWRFKNSISGQIVMGMT